MYCSKKCANRCHWLKVNKEKRADPNWKCKTALKLEATKSRRKEHEWLKANWYSSNRILNELSITWPRFNKIKEALQLVPKIRGASLEHFFSPQDFERIKNYSFPEIEIIPPRGYKTREQIQEQFSCGGAHWLYSKIARHRIKPKYKKWPIPGGGRCNIYRPEDIVEWLEEIERIKAKKNEERKKQTRERRERADKLARLEYEQKVSNAQKAIEGLDVVSLSGAAEILGISHVAMLGKLKEKRLKIQKGEYYWLRSDIEKLKEQKQQSIDKAQKNKDCKLRPDDWTSWQSYEQKRKELIRLFRETGYNSGKPYRRVGVKNNEEMWKKHENGEIVHLECIKCNKNLPYYNFYFDPTYQKGRRGDCKICCKKSRRIPEESNPRTPARFIACYTGSIKQSLTRKNKDFCFLSSVQVWHLIETHLGYNRNDLLKHLESKFTKKMNWLNHGRPSKPNEFRWQMDHIKPRSSFSYTSIEDDDFKECWSLDNLMPIEAKMNNYKSNKKLMQKVQSDLRRAIKENKRTKLFDHLPYNVDQLRNHFKSFDVKLDECGKTWTIDHIVPQAAKPFQSFKNKNFQTLLALDNLQPLTKSENSTKGSRYQDKCWYHNYDK
tara:strand:+ start:584 stop:2404 length:1821 start_codon:yes stop_codon:yes gene_type:complete